MASLVSSSPMTWKLETGSKVKTPGPAAEKSYRAATVKEFCSTEVADTASNIKLTIVLGGHVLAGRDDHQVFL